MSSLSISRAAWTARGDGGFLVPKLTLIQSAMGWPIPSKFSTTGQVLGFRVPLAIPLRFEANAKACTGQSPSLRQQLLDSKPDSSGSCFFVFFFGKAAA